MWAFWARNFSGLDALLKLVYPSATAGLHAALSASLPSKLTCCSMGGVNSLTTTIFLLNFNTE